MKRIIISVLIASITMIGMIGCSNEEATRYKEEMEKYSSIIGKDYKSLTTEEKLIVYKLEADIKDGNLSDKFLSNNEKYINELKAMRQASPEEEKAYEELLTSEKLYTELTSGESLALTQLEVKVADDNLSDEFKEKLNNEYKNEYDRLISEKDTYYKDLVAEKQNNKEVQAAIERENIIGTSSKKYSDIDTSKPSDVRNDTTGNWKLSRVATSENILEYVVDYYKTNFGNDKEIHAIVNFTLNTTTQISKLSDNILSVTIHEYLDKEEHDANKLFGGNVLGDYWIYLDNGDIEKID